LGLAAAGASHWARSSRILSGNASVMSIASRKAVSSSRVIGAPRSLRRHDEIGYDPDLALPAENVEQNALAVFGAHTGV
jgi:hypothetical protein